MTSLREQELQTAMKLLQNKFYLNNELLQQQLLKGLFHFGIFSQMIDDPELNRYLSPYIMNIVKQSQLNTYNEGKILNMQGQSYNTLYLILSGKVVFYQNKTQEEIANEMYFIKQEEKRYKEENKQQQERVRQFNEQMKQDNKKGKKGYSGNGNTQNLSSLQLVKLQAQLKEVKKTPKKYNEVYKIISKKQSSSPSGNNLQILRNPEDTLLRNNQQCSDQYYSGPICLYKIVDTKREGDYFGDIVNNQNGKKANYTIVVASQSILLQIGGVSFYQIFKNVIYQLNYVYQILELSFKGYTRKVLLEIALNSERIDFRQDQTIYKQGQNCKGFYILKEGEVALVYEKKKVKFLKKGSIFGHEDLFFKTRKLEAISDSNKTVVFQIAKKQASNFHFLKEVRELGESEYQAIVGIEGSQQSIYNNNNGLSLSNYTQISSSQKHVNTFMDNLSEKKGIHLNKSQHQILNRFISQRGSLSCSQQQGVVKRPFVNFLPQDFQNNNVNNLSPNVTKEGSRIMMASKQFQNNNTTNNNNSNTNVTQILKPLNLGLHVTSSVKSAAAKSQLGSHRGVNTNSNVERFAMIRDQDVFNEEDYSKGHHQEIKAIKKINKIIINGDRKVFIDGNSLKQQQQYQQLQKQSNQDDESSQQEEEKNLVNSRGHAQSCGKFNSEKNFNYNLAHSGSVQQQQKQQQQQQQKNSVQKPNLYKIGQRLYSATPSHQKSLSQYQPKLGVQFSNNVDIYNNRNSSKSYQEFKSYNQLSQQYLVTPTNQQKKNNGPINKFDFSGSPMSQSSQGSKSPNFQMGNSNGKKIGNNLQNAMSYNNFLTIKQQKTVENDFQLKKPQQQQQQPQLQPSMTSLTYGQQEGVEDYSEFSKLQIKKAKLEKKMEQNIAAHKDKSNNDL